MSRAAVIRSLAVLVALLVAAPAAAAPRYLGVQVHPLWSSESHADMLRDVGRLADLGVNVARADVGWSSLQGSGPGSFESWYVDRLDAFVAAAHARGIKVIATLTETPCWASTAPAALKQGCAGSWWDRGVQDYPPADPLDYGRAAKFLTARYGTRLAALEIWNEPNLSYEFISPAGKKAARYAALVRATYPLAKQGDPRVPVLAGATAYADVSFLRKLYAAGIAGAHDGISIHPYSDGRGPASEAAPARLEFGPGIRSIRAAQIAAGQPKPLWLTEFGFTACSWCGTLAAQATLIADTTRAIPQFPYVRGATLYQLRDTATLPDSWEDNFGLLRQDFTPRPAYAAFKRAAGAVAVQWRRAARSR
ncbi:MAG: glycoside hydrolase family 5 protein [Solirubrobacterales bacterium]|nr:glycoside hydrolase family 5 protein [Solirubrobacterales bacterium]